MAQTEKQLQYAAMLSGKIAEIFDEESEYHIDHEELQEGAVASYTMLSDVLFIY